MALEKKKQIDKPVVDGEDSYGLFDYNLGRRKLIPDRMV
jgi:hypothetical protein